MDIREARRKYQDALKRVTREEILLVSERIAVAIMEGEPDARTVIQKSVRERVVAHFEKQGYTVEYSPMGQIIFSGWAK